MTHTEATARCWAEISLDEICGNYLRAREITNSSAEIICVLKGNAYGMGATAVCKALMDVGAKTFAVASGDEAEELLAACPGADVLVLGLVGEEQTRRLIEKNAIFTLFSSDQGMMLARVAESMGAVARVHVKAETGLCRLGFAGAGVNKGGALAPTSGVHTGCAAAYPRTSEAQWAGAVNDIAALHACGHLRMEGLFTHLALHNAESDAKQLSDFLALRDALAARGITFAKVHALDSIGMVRYPEYHLDAVRIGAWLYGVIPNRYPHPENCRMVISIKARVAQLHDVAAGGLIGYDDNHPLSRDSRIATLTAGYADGIPRFCHAGEVIIRGCRAKIVGLVCMDQLMVDVTDIPGVEAGDVATFLGDGIHINDYAASAGLNRNDVLSRTGRRVTRVYTYRGEVFYSNSVLE